MSRILQPIVNETTVIKNHRIAYGVYGVGTPVVLIHGALASSIMWRKVYMYIVKAGFKVHVWDMLGYGESERPWDVGVDTSITGQAVLLTQLYDHWEIQSAHIVAHGLGGGVAQRFCLENPPKALSLVLIGSVSHDSLPCPRTVHMMRPGVGAMLSAEQQVHSDRFTQWLLTGVYDRKGFEAGGLPAYMAYISTPVGQASVVQHQLRFYSPAHTMDVATRLFEIGHYMKTKIIWGEQDDWQDPQWASRLNSEIPSSKVKLIPNCGHFATEDQPDQVAYETVEFLHGVADENDEL